MKKIFCVVLMLCVVVFGVFSQAGTIQELTGEVELKPAGAASFTPARVGSTVAQDTVVSTGFKGTAIIVIGSSTITVRPLTRLSLSEIQMSSGAETLNLNLQAGRIKVDVKPPEGTKAAFTVQSPSATASVRGTSFEMDTLNLNVTQGTVSYTGGNNLGILVSGGSGSSIDNNGNATSPQTNFDASLMPPAPGTSGGAGVPAGPTSPSTPGNPPPSGGTPNDPGSVDIGINYN